MNKTNSTNKIQNTDIESNHEWIKKDLIRIAKKISNLEVSDNGKVQNKIDLRLINDIYGMTIIIRDELTTYEDTVKRFTLLKKEIKNKKNDIEKINYDITCGEEMIEEVIKSRE